MSSGTAIIQTALQKIGAYSVVSPPQPESITLARDALNSMLALWLKKGIDLGVNVIAAAGDELGEPLDARNAIIDNLAPEIAPFFGGSVVSNDLSIQARTGYNDIARLYRVIEIPEKVVSSTMPMGAGNKGRVFAGKGKTVT